MVLLEFPGGLALIAGAFVPILAGVFVGHMLVVMVTVHLSHGYSFISIIGTGLEGMPEFGMPGYDVRPSPR